MFHFPVSEVLNFKSVLNATAAGQTAVTSSSVDVQPTGARGFCFLVKFGAITATEDSTGTAKVKLQESSDDSTWTDVTGAEVDIKHDDDADDDLDIDQSNGILSLDIWKPLKQYLRLSITRSTQNSAIDGAICMMYGTKNAQEGRDASYIDSWHGVGED